MGSPGRILSGPARKTLTGAWIVDLSANISASRVQDALHALRTDPGILWVDDKAMPLRPAAAKDGNGRDNDPTDPEDASTDEDECGAKRSTWQGTFVSEIIAAATNNGTGVAGMSSGAKILPVRMLGKCGGTFTDVLNGMVWASGLPVAGGPANAYPARILNMSLGAETGGCPDFRRRRSTPWWRVEPLWSSLLAIRRRTYTTLRRQVAAV